MKLTATLVSSILLLAVLPGVCSSGLSRAQTHDHAAQATAGDLADGITNPSGVSDSVAYDIFLRSFTFRPEESAYAAGWLRALANEMGLSATEADALRRAAAEYDQLASVLDERAARISDRRLPNLTMQDAAELAELQRRKEALVASFVASFPDRLGQRLAGLSQSYVERRVKPRVRNFQPQTTPQLSQHKPVRFMTTGLSPAQTYNGVGMNGYGHLYISSWQDAAANSVCGRGLVTEDYNMYGHTWSVQARVYNPEGTRSQASLVEFYRATTSSTTGLPILDEFGGFSVEVTIKERCPYVLGLLALGIFIGDEFFALPTELKVVYIKAFFQEGNDPEAPESSALASSDFDGVRTTLNVKTRLGPDTCTGHDAFILQASFQPPPSTASVCGSTSTCRVAVSRNSNFDISPNPVNGFTSRFYTDFVSRADFVAVRLKKRADVTGAISGTLIITVNGSFQSGDSFTGPGFVKLVCQ
ncbi:MAG TPA: hypothetical protein VF546_23560 [Pyrinomonadaceae bacterium]|jgi:hypothetical protein